MDASEGSTALRASGRRTQPRRWRASAPLRWLKRHQHALGARQVLDCAQRAYDLARRSLAEPERPAAAGGWPVRLVPLPAPRPYRRGERRALLRVLRAQETSYFDGGSIRAFEDCFAARFGARHAIAVSSGTAALHCALVAAGIGPGDEVLVPALTYVATAFAALYQGARVRFVDVDPATLGIDPRALEAAITERTRAVIPVHLCGVPCDMGAVLEIAARRGLRVIEDAAQAHGATWRGRCVGTLGHLGCFSFGATKNIVTGEGGMVLTDDAELARRARLAMCLGERAYGRPALEVRGFEPSTRVDYELLGWNYRMSALQAALGSAQLERWDATMASIARNARRLRERLSAATDLRFQAMPDEAGACYSTFFFLLPEHTDRAALCAGLARERIDHRLPLVPLPEHAIFGDAGDYPGAARVHARGLGLRVDPALGAREMDAAAEALLRNLRGVSSARAEPSVQKLAVTPNTNDKPAASKPDECTR